MANVNGRSIGRAIGKGVGVFFQILGTLFLVGIITTLIFGCIFAKYVKEDLSTQVDFNIEDFTLDQTSVIYYYDPATGDEVELQQLYGEENRVWASYSQIPEDLANACVAIEDKRFYEHQGVDWVTTAKACVNMFLGGESSFGGSTITQQLIKNLTDEDEVTVRRKLVEIFRALEFEQNYKKDQIMEWYLNTIYLGQGCYGVQSASRVYFGKDVSELTLAECASLISITNNPSLYDPYINAENNRSRQTTVLGAMLGQEIISQAEYDEAMAQEMVFVNTSGQDDDDSNGYYSYFVDQVIRDVERDLQEKTGFSSTMVSQMVKAGGYKIYTTLNPDIQAIVDDTYENLENIPATKSLQQLQSAITIIDNDTGDIVAMSGGVGEKTGSLTFNRATQAYLSPGSTIKPVAVYAPALEEGIITPASVYDDTPYIFDGSSYWPNNESRTFSGLTSVNTAVSQSTNTVPVKILAELTVEKSFAFAQEEMGLDSLVETLVKGDLVYSDMNYAPLALGDLTTGVTVTDMAAAYGVFANQGIYREPRTYTMVVDGNGNVVLDNTQEKHQAVSEDTAWYMTYMLENVVKYGTGTSAQVDNMSVAGKTGTTSDDKARWFCGYTPYYTAAVWCGYDQPEEVVLTDSTMNPAVYLWERIMEEMHQELDALTFIQPGDVVNVQYCMDSGLLATAACSNDVRGSRVTYGLLLAEDVPVDYCDVHTNVSICGESGCVANEYCYMVEENHTYDVGLLNLLRAFPVSGIVVQDQQYVFFDAEMIPQAYYSAVSPNTNSYTTICGIHTELVLEPEEEEEEVEYDEDGNIIYPPETTEPEDPTLDVEPDASEPEEEEQPEDSALGSRW